MRNRGFTLIEVLIALVIFVIGALAVIRIFPPAFHVVQNSGYSNVATRLSDSILSQMKGEGSTPDAVFDIDDSGSWASNVVEASWLDQDGSVVANNDLNGSLPKGPSPDAYSASALNHFKFIRGESHYIQNSAGNSATSDTPYLLTNFPYTADNTAGGVHLYINLTIHGVTIDSNGRLDFSDATYTNPFNSQTSNFYSSTPGYSTRPPEYVSNSGSIGAASNSAVLLFRSPIGTPSVNAGARFYVSYRYIDGATGKTNSVFNEPLNLPDDATWNTEAGGNDDENYVLQGLLRKKLLSNKPTIDAGSVQVTARGELVFLPSGTSISISNIVSSAIPLGTDQNFGNHGVVTLPPVYADGPPISSLMPTAKISIDYLVPSWSILFNQSVANDAGQVSLPVSLLDNNFSVLGLATQSNDNSPAAFATPTSVDYTTGQVTYPVAVKDTPIRTVYQGLDQWATQISPSAQSYIPFENSGTLSGFRATGNPGQYFLPHEPWREYLFASGDNVIYFHTSEAGKTVQVNFIPTGSTQPIKQVLTIDKAIGKYGVTTDYASTGYVARLQLKDINGNAVQADGILGINGLGIVARTAWLNGSNYQQSVVEGYRTNAG